MTSCPICGKEYKNVCRHAIMTHKITKEEFCTKYVKPISCIITKCPICGTSFANDGRYKKICCSQNCSAKYRQFAYTHDLDVEQFEKEHDCTNIVKLREIYGQGWYKAKVITNYIESGIQTQMFFVKNSDIHLIEEYCEVHRFSGKSHTEKHIAKLLKDMSIIVLENNKKVIYPKELDIFLPDLNIAIEYNGDWCHSIENGLPKDYHLMKSLACREKSIRLIHIYEFEDIETQIRLLIDLVNGQDNYPKNDFNKNNLIDNIPEPELIHTDARGHHIYGAGKLY